MWPGWVEFNGNEIINTARTEAYADTYRLSWFRPQYKSDLADVLGETYVDPETDDAPWIDPRIPESREFYGVYPLGVSGIEDSTLGTTVIESLRDGGTATGYRRATKTPVFNVVLVAASEAGAQHGLQWLKRVIGSGPCGGAFTCSGHEMRYFSSVPHLGDWSGLAVCVDRRDAATTDPETAENRLLRRLRRTEVLQGPVVTGKQVASDDSAIWTAQFTFTVGNPAEYTTETEFLVDWLDPDPDPPSPWPGGSPPAGASVTTTPSSYTDVDCSPAPYVPIFDPLAPAIAPPPQPAAVPWVTFDPPTDWDRYKAVIPADLIPSWGEWVPVITLHSDTADIRNARVRIYPDPDETGDMPVDGDCDFVADMIASFIPSNGALTYDGVDQIAYVDTVLVSRQRADSLVFSTDGGPYVWPVLTCGVQYVLFIDVPVGDTPPAVDISFAERFA